MTRVALDSNILVYLAGLRRVPDDQPKIERVRALVASLSGAVLIAPVQALGELFVVLCRGGASAADARAIVQRFAEGLICPSSEQRAAYAAIDLVVDHKLQFWDALIVAASADAGCALLLSEDMQDGFVARGLTIVNPLAAEPHPKLTALLTA